MRLIKLAQLPLAPYFLANMPQYGLSLSFVKLPENKIREGMDRLLKIVLEVAGESTNMESSIRVDEAN